MAETQMQPDEIREFLHLLREWRLSRGALGANVLGGETGRATAVRIEEARREKLLEFLDLPGIDVALEASLDAAIKEGKGNG